MVALLDKSLSTSKTALRARGATSSFNSRRAAALKSRNRIELGGFTYDACDRLGSCSNEPIGYEGSEWNFYEYAVSSPSTFVDSTGLACHLCTTLESVTAEKDASGKVIGCALKYKFDANHQTRVVQGGACPKECEPVADCLDIPNLEKMKIIQLREPKWKGLPFFKTAYCPPLADWNQTYCFAVNAKNCKSDYEDEFKDCIDLCNNGSPARHLCKAIKVPVLKQLCEAMVNGSVENCIYYCETSRVKREDD
jgi:hypothetical protein